MTQRGHPFPDIDKLRLALVLRGWTRDRLAAETGLSISVVNKAVQGRPVAIETIERISEVLVANPPDTATAAFVREGTA